MTTNACCKGRGRAPNHRLQYYRRDDQEQWTRKDKGAIVDIMSFALVDVNVESVSEMVELVQGKVEENLCF